MENTTIGFEEKNIRRSALVSDIAIGMSDGLTVPFALAAGLSVVTDSADIILLAGIIAVVAGAASMGIGGYYATKSEMADEENELMKDESKTVQAPSKSKEEIKAFYANLGLPEEVQQQATEEILKDKEQWVDTMTKYEAIVKTNPKQAVRSGLNIALAYIAGGLIPLSPYLFFAKPMEALKTSVVVTLICLFLFGWIKSKITGMTPWTGALRASIFGALAAGGAFLVARLFEA